MAIHRNFQFTDPCVSSILSLRVAAATRVYSFHHPTIMLAYLSGSIENSPDGGRAWRAALKPFLAETLRHQIYDPAEAIPQLLGAETYESFRGWKTSDPDRFRATVRRVIAHDLEVLTTRTSYVICNWDEYVLKGGGTQGELTVAYYRSIPVYLVTHVPLENISGWILGCADLVLPNFAELRKFLEKRYTEKNIHL